jgi:hypothetical protein
MAALGRESDAVADFERLLREQGPAWAGRTMAERELAAVRARRRP